MFKLCPLDFKRGILCLRGLELGLSLRYVFVRVDAGLVQSPRQIEGLLISDHSRIQQLLQGILSAKLKVIFGKVGLDGEAGILEIGRASLRAISG